MTETTRQLPAIDYRQALDVTIAAAVEAGAVLRAEFHRPGGPRGGHGHCDADAAAEGLLRDRLLAAFPDFGAVGEELGARNRPPADAGGHLWLIDPNDGTAAFLRGHRGSAVSVALLRDGAPVLGVVYAFSAPDDSGDLIAWAEGCGPVTRNGKPVAADRGWPERLEAGDTVLVSQSADKNSEANAEAVAPARFRAVPSIAYRLALVAAGEAVAGVSLNGPGGWDYAAGHALLRGAGGNLFADGKPITYTREGSSHGGSVCVGGGPGVAVALSTKDWSAVFKPAKEVPSIAGPAPFDLSRPAAGVAVADAGLLSRARGCLLGQVAGDSLGSLVEFTGPDEAQDYFDAEGHDLADGGHWNTLAGQPTDDSEMALMLARSLVKAGRYDADAAAAAYAWWYDSRPFDMGFTTSTALSPASAAVRSGQPPAAAARAAANHDSQANGALMRVSPLGVFGHAASPAQVAAWARADATLTHPHEVCVDANAVYAVAIAHAIRTGVGPQAVYEFAMNWAWDHPVHSDVRYTMDAAASRRPDDYVSKMGWVRIALQNAFYQLLHAPTLRDGVVDTVRRGGDTDTTGAIAGALLGAVHGAAGVPAQWRDRVLCCRPIVHLAGVRRPRPKPFWPVDVMVLAEHLVVKGA